MEGDFKRFKLTNKHSKKSVSKMSSAAPFSKQSRNTLLQSVVNHLLATYSETGNYDDKVSAETIHSLVNDSSVVDETISFITSSRLVKSTFKSAFYDKDTKIFHGLAAKAVQSGMSSITLMTAQISCCVLYL